MLTVSTYGHRAAGNILSQALNTIASDPRVDMNIKKFIIHNIFVDDGVISSQYKDKLKEMSQNLPTAFANYSYKIKHVLLNLLC